MSITFVWTIVLVIAIIVEAITVDLVSIWFGLGAIAALIGEFFGLDQTLQNCTIYNYFNCLYFCNKTIG